MLKQKVKGVTININANGSEEDITALLGLMVGEITQFDLKGQGGTRADLPQELNKKVFIVGAKSTENSGRLSTMITLPHVKASKMSNEIAADIKNKFNANYETAIKADYVNLKFDK
ncbi:hypothetical protein [Campylobacter hyointestinalis]|uniref:Uncharacterized protein n=2 Tax=Campylobacter hyointestinalis TaxID=198 RepID=A0AAV6EBZ5_CAMHY|nr:hypothetical protein [Campylobacter hyointestinalis]KAB0610917.1 hypothetical protein F7P66_08985 [Campylobacter hyointestinalis subsp. lawsonii]QKF69742.1 hypothetical protein CHLWT_1183 [Campylobacter hyointestinalis subsp. lawsonii]RAZ27095.1 hypothetical protein CHLT_09210 [Campylobacter hyointestinalis subsp. lawsonii]TWO23105.1 hypothetical protein YZ82_00770 [Campylobacter hyointestinalis]